MTQPAVRPPAGGTSIELAPGEADIGAIYDRSTDLMTATHGGYEHGGYWDGLVPPTDIMAAGDQLSDEVLTRCGLARGDRLLDVGCGSGKVALRAARRHRVEVTGVTLSRYEAQLANQLAAREQPEVQLRFEIADMRQMPFGDATFDAAIAIESICHLVDRAAAFTEIARVLRPGGRIALTDFLLRKPVEDPVHRSVVETSARDFGTGPIINIAEYSQALRAGGLEIIELVDIGEQVRPSWDAVADAIMAYGGTAAGRDSAAELTAVATGVRDFGKVTEIGYLLAVAARPR